MGCLKQCKLDEKTPTKDWTSYLNIVDGCITGSEKMEMLK